MEHDDFAVEPVRGLPEKPPAGEIILWQGRPDTIALARDALNLNWIIGYFALLIVWRVGVSSADFPFAQALTHAIPFVAIGAVTVGLILFIAWVQAKATVYTVTSARVAMRVGAALTVTLNLPYTRIEAADLDLRKAGTGTIAFRTAGETKLSFLVLWPHVRPWHAKRTQPALRCIPEAEKVARMIAEAVEMRMNRPQVARRQTADAVAAE
jgi:membrane protein YdbS with pleckstrin-like domain